MEAGALGRAERALLPRVGLVPWGSYSNVLSGRIALNKSPGAAHSAALQNTVSSEANKSVQTEQETLWLP